MLSFAWNAPHPFFSYDVPSIWLLVLNSLIFPSHWLELVAEPLCLPLIWVPLWRHPVSQVQEPFLVSLTRIPSISLPCCCYCCSPPPPPPPPLPPLLLLLLLFFFCFPFSSSSSSSPWPIATYICFIASISGLCLST